MTATFVAIDFETADPRPDSACAVALVRVENGRTKTRSSALIRPPRREFTFTDVHGLTWDNVCREPVFAEVWSRLTPLLEGVEFLAAHNAAFDRGVLAACCAAARLPAPRLPWECTVALARRTWGIYPTRLPDVCAALRIPLQHHDAASDAEACAEIVLRARAESKDRDRGPRRNPDRFERR